MRSFSFLSATYLVLLQSVAASQNVVVEYLPSVPTGWIKLRDADPQQLIRLRIALKQPNLPIFEKTLYDISSPQHPLYGKHLSREEVAELMKPDEESTDAVMQWLVSAGIPASNVEDAGQWVNFRTTVEMAEKLLDANFAIYQPVGTTAERIRTLEYSVPEDVKAHITMIQPTTRFGQLKGQRSLIHEVYSEEQSVQQFNVAADVPSTELDVKACNSSITPECLRALYNVGNYQANPSVNTTVGVSGFLEEYAKHDALDTFLAQFAPYALTQNFTTTLVNGGLDKQNDTVDDDGEANLDMQYVAALAYETNIKFYSVGGRGLLVPDLDQPNPSANSNEPYLDFLEYLTALPDDELPSTLSTSYGEDEQSVPKEYVQKVCNMFGELGARGVSVIFSSGDTGPGSACQTNDGTNRTRLLPTFPAACPYVTSVGATMNVQPERAVSFSSGGFSDVFARPSYQDTAVQTYLDSIGDTFAGLYNTTGRGFPDVAAQGVRFQVVTQGVVAGISGTSASAPTFAGIISLLNNALIANGKSPLGFLNPWLYSKAASGFTDITAGGSRGCTGIDIYSMLPTPVVPGAGWNATTGWDPVTGLGTPLFDKLLRMVAPSSYGSNGTMTKIGAKKLRH